MPWPPLGARICSVEQPGSATAGRSVTPASCSPAVLAPASSASVTSGGAEFDTGVHRELVNEHRVAVPAGHDQTDVFQFVDRARSTPHC